MQNCVEKKQKAMSHDAQILAACLARIADQKQAESMVESAVTMLTFLVSEAMFLEAMHLACALKDMLKRTSSSVLSKTFLEMCKTAKSIGLQLGMQESEDNAQDVFALAEYFNAIVLNYFEERQERNEEVIVPPDYLEARRVDHELCIAQGNIAMYRAMYLSDLSPPPMSTQN